MDLEKVKKYVEENIDSFHQKRLVSLENLKLEKILKRKNPYLFKAKNILTAQDLIKKILDAHLSSQEETIFGDFLENLAIFVNQETFGGWKSSADGIDLEFDKDNIRYIVSVKSGPNWGNSSQIAKMIGYFKKAKKILRTGNSKLNIIAVNGCCYGRCGKTDKGDYFKICGQEFWHFISDDNNLYIKIIEPLGYKAKEKNEKFLQKYAQIINKFTSLFLSNFCLNGEINWEKLIRYNSSKEKINLPLNLH